MTSPTASRLVVEAGGSTTRASLRGATGVPVHRLFGPVNPASVGRAGTLAQWCELLGWATGHGTEVVGWIASASVAPGTVDDVTAMIEQAAARTGLHGTIVVSNDILPLLLAPPVAGHGVALIAGTGSGCVARCAGRTVRVGGHEYVLSDDGSGYWIGLRGLRAASRAQDGTGPGTLLVAHAVRFGDCSIPVLGRRLAQSSAVKSEVSRFAPHVIAAADAGDSVASAIVRQAVERLVAMVSTAARHVHGAKVPLAVVGSLVHASAYFRAQFLDRLSGACPGMQPVIMPDGVACTWRLLEGDGAVPSVTAPDIGDEVLRTLRIAPPAEQAHGSRTALIGDG